MKTNAIVRIVLYSIVILLLAGIIVVGIGLGKHWVRFGSGADGTVTSSGTADPSKIRDITIEWAAGSITIQPGDVDVITFTESASENSRYTMVTKESGGKLTIAFGQDSIFGGISIGSIDHKDLVITVPRGWACSSLDIEAASAEVTVTDMAIQEVEIESASGVCTFTSCQIGSLDVDTASGNVKFTGTLDTLEFDGMSARFTSVLDNTPSRMTMDTMSGDMDITLPADSGFTATIDAMSSDFSSDFPAVRQNESYVCGDGSCRISVSAMSGDVTIHMGKE